MSMKFRQSWTWQRNDIELILKKINMLPKPVLHVCSGSSNIGDIRIDRYKINCFFRDGHKRWKDKYLGKPTILGDMCLLPIKSGSIPTIICDPPYTFEYQKDERLIDELARVLKPGGNLIFYAPWVSINKVLECKQVTPYKIGKKQKYFKLFSEFIKVNGQISDYFSSDSGIIGEIHA